jgi:hypothetical protein
MASRKPSRPTDRLGQFLDFNSKVLRFYGYWDDRESLYGMLHDLEIHYYLADGTIEIKESIPPNSGCDSGFMFLRRCKLLKVKKQGALYVNMLNLISIQNCFYKKPVVSNM